MMGIWIEISSGAEDGWFGRILGRAKRAMAWRFGTRLGTGKDARRYYCASKPTGSIVSVFHVLAIITRAC